MLWLKVCHIFNIVHALLINIELKEILLEMHVTRQMLYTIIIQNNHISINQSNSMLFYFIIFK